MPPGQKPYELKEKDAIETAIADGALYSSARSKTLRIPAAVPGSVTGYEYETRSRPYVLEDTWYFGDRVPTRLIRYILDLPDDWDFDAHWIQCSEPEAQRDPEDRVVWELRNIPALVVEPAMPPERAVTARTILSFYSGKPGLRASSHSSWQDVGRSYARLAADRRRTSPEIRQKVAELTLPTSNPLEKIKALAAFVQREIRYVAIEIGMGRFKPSSAQEVLANRYGDCKDKATLLSTMLSEIGVESDYVLINTDRGVLVPDVPSFSSFNHAILAIHLPPEVTSPRVDACVTIESGDRLLFFDPADAVTPLGSLPAALQANQGLLVTDDGGVLLELPAPPPAANQVLRYGRFTLGSDGTLVGEVEETRWGALAVSYRRTVLRAPLPQQTGIVETLLSRSLSTCKLQSTHFDNLETYEDSLIVNYAFVASRYAKKAERLLFVRPQVVYQGVDHSLDARSERVHPFVFECPSSQIDIYEIQLPSGYGVDEIPERRDIRTDFADYNSATTVHGNILRYSRTQVVKNVQVGAERFEELRTFFGAIASEKRDIVALKEIPQSTGNQVR